MTGPVKVLIVDDSRDLRDLLGIKVEMWGGYQVVGLAADGEEAVDLARTRQPDLVLLDLAMPKMDGLQALPLILEAAPGVRVVVLSGFDKGSMAERALAAGAHRYVEKGLSTRELGTVVAEVLASA
ncbi:response regulator transcription factor [Nocardioides marmoribigeumensis]|uniref:YesN/AraC family two-component response regulator n=1 Tax=Nocardioides marmoribigeumensis TaxID=433649 RepID=A0ABU2BYZ9_9ACTN|nr:response regulator transcription factor [Nocardioides marmoribigeumensis]MDR7363619.1 YesN/AraC family two-component response regulator [Nocardioides marmoribigeumensis]